MKDNLTIIKQLASKLTSFGFANEPRTAKVQVERLLTEHTFVVRAVDLVVDAPVFALVVRKGHVPLQAEHVVDFRIGADIY